MIHIDLHGFTSPPSFHTDFHCGVGKPERLREATRAAYARTKKSTRRQ
jgi:hypothetical protein